MYWKGEERRQNGERKEKRGCDEVELHTVSLVCTNMSHLSSGPSHNPVSEMKLLTHFSLGFLLFMMKSFVKETKTENKVHPKEEIFSTNPYFYFIPERSMP